MLYLMTRNARMVQLVPIKGGLCSMSDVLDSCKDAGGGGGSPVAQASVRIKHVTSQKAEESSRFPKLDECAHFHYDNVEIGAIEVSLCEEKTTDQPAKPTSAAAGVEDQHQQQQQQPQQQGEMWFCARVCSNGRSWDVKRSLDNFQMLDRQLHKCVFERKFSGLTDIAEAIQREPRLDEDGIRSMLKEYLERFSQLAGSLINCGPVLNWLELDNRGYRLIVTDEAAINTPAVAAAYVVKRYAAQANDEIPLEVGDIISVIDMPPPEESTWWRGKKGFQVGFFPCECVEIIGDKVPNTIKVPKVPAKPVLRKHGKLIAFFRQFLLSRPSRRKLKQSGILKERVFGCDLGEHLMNSGRDIPLVLKCCAEFIEEYGIVDGIYRLSGVTSNIQKLRHAFDEDRVPNLMDEAILQDIHCVASLLKMYFRELPNPLLTFHLYDKFVSAVQADEDIRLLRLRDVVQQLPPPHYRSLEYLMRHLSAVAAHGSQTGMTPKNVAIVWAPNLLRSREIENGGVGALHVVGVQAVLTEYLIRYTDLIFSQKMPTFPSPIPGEETPKKMRPKSLAISTPTKLLSLEEARSRALASNVPSSQFKFIEVGGGTDNLPVKYHTVIETSSLRSSGKAKKSPSGWKSFFSRGWHTTSGRSKTRRRSGTVGQRPKISSPIFVHNLNLSSQDKDVTEIEVPQSSTKKLRTVKSAESLLFGTALTSQNIDNVEIRSPLDETGSSQATSIEYTPLQEVVSSSSPKSPSYQKHMRSTSHDSYFENVIEFEACPAYTTYRHPKTSPVEECTSDSEYADKQSPTPLKSSITTDAQAEVGDSSAQESRTSQKQKYADLDSDVSSPKLQKLSLKRLYQTLSSPPIVRRSKSDTGSKTTKSRRTGGVIELSLTSDLSSGRATSLRSAKTGSGVQREGRSCTSSMTDGDRSMSSRTADDDEDEYESEDGSSYVPSLEESVGERTSETKERLISASMEATLSDTISISQLLSYESQNGVEGPHDLIGACGRGSSNVTPDSPTMDNVSEMPSSAGSDINVSPADVQAIEKQLSASWPSDKFALEEEMSKAHHGKRRDSQKSSSVDDNAMVNGSGTSAACKKGDPVPDDEMLAEKTSTLRICANVEEESERHSDHRDEHDVHRKADGHLPRDKPDTGRANGGGGGIDGPPEHQLLKGLGRSQTESAEMCAKLDMGITSSQSFGPRQLAAVAQDALDAMSGKKRNNDRVSPLSPMEESKRRFESEIGRLIVRDRQMRLEMERMKAERQNCKPIAETAARINSTYSYSTIPKTKDDKRKETSEFKKSPAKKKLLSLEDSIILTKDNQETKKPSDWSSTIEYPHFIRMENKPSVKELLTKFESCKYGEGPKSIEAFGSPTRNKGSVFLNVQVVNHQDSSNSVDHLGGNLKSFEPSKTRSNHEHIFQTECVVRFPHPKASSSISSGPSSLPCSRGTSDFSSLPSSTFLNTYLRSRSNSVQESSASASKRDCDQYSGRSRETTTGPRTVFRFTGTSCDTKLRVTDSHDVPGSSSTKPSGGERGIMAKNTDLTSPFLLRNVEGTQTNSEADDVKPSVRLKKEFLKSLAQFEDVSQGRQAPAQCAGGPFQSSADDRLIRTSHRHHRSPAKQRPRSVPPPSTRLALSAATPPTAVDEAPAAVAQAQQDCPKYKAVPNDGGDASPPRRIRDRAAMFERSFSFSGYSEKKRLTLVQAKKTDK